VLVPVPAGGVDGHTANWIDASGVAVLVRFIAMVVSTRVTRGWAISADPLAAVCMIVVLLSMHRGASCRCSHVRLPSLG